MSHLADYAEAEKGAYNIGEYQIERTMSIACLRDR